MVRLEDLEFVLTSKGQFNPKDNIRILFPYLVEKVDNEGVVNLRNVQKELSTLLFDRDWEINTTQWNIAAELVSPQYELKTIQLREAIEQYCSRFDLSEGINNYQRSRLLYKTEDALKKYIMDRFQKRQLIMVELKEGKEL